MRAFNWKKLYRVLRRELSGRVEYGVKLKQHTSFHIGGKAKIMVFPNSEEDIIKALHCMEGYPYYVLGGGTNVLACDEDYEGVVIKLSNYVGITQGENVIEVLSGTPLAQVCKHYENLSLSGVEELFGIPGTIGGAVVMNAGANGKEISQVVAGALVYSGDKIHYCTNEECSFSYRHSRFQQKDIVLKVFLTAKQGNRAEIRAKMNEFISKRKASQPLGFPSAGSIFKRKGDIIVSKMIDCEGLKGYNINDAEISRVHAGFIVNKGNATCKDVLALIDFLKKYFIRKGIELEEEICFLRNDYRRLK